MDSKSFCVCVCLLFFCLWIFFFGGEGQWVKIDIYLVNNKNCWITQFDSLLPVYHVITPFCGFKNKRAVL